MDNVMAVDQLLEQTAKEKEVNEAKAKKQGNHSGDERRDSRDRKDDRDGRERDRHDRGRDRDGERDRHRDRDRYRESNNERNRSRDRDRRRRDDSRPRSSTKVADTDDEGPQRHRRDDRDRSRDRHRGSRRDDRRGGDYYSGGGRARSRSRSPRRGRDDRDRYRSDRDRSRDRRRRDGDDRRSGRRTTTPEEAATTEDDRDKRTIFVQQISQRAETRHLRSFFEAVGPVVEAQIVKDRVTGRSKGVGYVEFKDEESVPKAIELTGQKLKGVPIIAQHTEAEKNRASRATESSNTTGNGAPFHRLYVGNIHFSVTEDDLVELFGPFGELDQVTLQKEEGTNGGRSKGYGFVQFTKPEAAKAALESMNGFELANRPIRVGLGNDKFTPESTASLLRNFNSQAQNFQGSAFSGSGGRGAYAGGSGGVFDRTHGRDDRGVSGASALDDTDVAGININHMNRDRLMNLLARNPVEEPAKNGSKKGLPVAKPREQIVDKPMPSKCIKIQDAFNPEQELAQYGPDWTKGLENEVKTECDQKYGKVVHISADANTDGDIYVKFDSVSAGEKALQGLNGRTFNYRSIRASFVVDKIYNSLFGAAASKF